jgi:hypothetical protein
MITVCHALSASRLDKDGFADGKDCAHSDASLIPAVKHHEIPECAAYSSMTSCYGSSWASSRPSTSCAKYIGPEDGCKSKYGCIESKGEVQSCYKELLSTQSATTGALFYLSLTRAVVVFRGFRAGSLGENRDSESVCL